MQSFCILFEGILARQRELHARAAEFVAEQAAMDTCTSPRKGPQDAFGSTEGVDSGAHDSAIGGPEAVGGGFAPSPAVIDQTFLFAMIWGLGGGLTGDPALALDVYVRDLVQVSDNRSIRQDPCRSYKFRRCLVFLGARKQVGLKLTIFYFRVLAPSA